MLNRQILKILPLLLLVLVVGCVPKAINVPPKAYVAKGLSVTGDFYLQDSKGRRTDYSMTASKKYEALPYAIKGKDLDCYFQTYKIGDLVLAFITAEDKNGVLEKEYVVTRLTITRTQLAFESLDEKFFKKNPDALPGTRIVKSGNSTKVELHATPEQLVAFFKLHSKTAGLFNTNDPMLFNRIP